MSYVEKHLIEGETIVYATRLHWIVLVKPLLFGFIFGAAGTAVFVRAGVGDNAGKSVLSGTMLDGVGAILIGVAVVCIAQGILRRNATEMAVTNKRVVAKVGVAARRTIELLLSRVESIAVEESLTGRMLGYGTVILRGTGGTPESFDLIAHPLEFRTQVQQQIEKSQGK